MSNTTITFTIPNGRIHRKRGETVVEERYLGEFLTRFNLGLMDYINALYVPDTESAREFVNSLEGEDLTKRTVIHPITRKRVKEIWFTETLPNYGFTLQQYLEECFKKRV